MQGPEVGVGLICSGNSNETRVARSCMLERERVREIKGKGPGCEEPCRPQDSSYCDHRDKRR